MHAPSVWCIKLDKPTLFIDSDTASTQGFMLDKASASQKCVDMCMLTHIHTASHDTCMIMG